MQELNPYQTPKSANPQDDDVQFPDAKFQHRNFRLTIDEVHENRHFVIGNLRQAMCFAFIQQAVWMVFMASTLDGGRLLKLATAAAATFWALTVTTAILQKGRMTREQNLAVKWGYLPVFLIVVNIWHLLMLFS